MQNLPPGPADDIAKTEDAEGHIGVGYSRSPETRNRKPEIRLVARDN
jgi:hypothetical protein